MEANLKITIRPGNGKAYKANIEEVSQKNLDYIFEQLSPNGTTLIFNYKKEKLSNKVIREILTPAFNELEEIKKDYHEKPITYATIGLNNNEEEVLRGKLKDGLIKSFFILAWGKKLKKCNKQLPKPTQVLFATYTELSDEITN